MKRNFFLRKRISFTLLLFGFLGLWAQKPELLIPIGHNGNIRSLALSSNGDYLLSGGLDGTVKLWDIASGEQIKSYDVHERVVVSVTNSPDGNYFLTFSNEPQIKLWDINSGRLVRTFLGHQANVNTAQFSPDGKFILSGSNDKKAILWEVASGDSLQVLEGHQEWIKAVAFSPDGKKVATGSADRSIRVWDLEHPEDVRVFSGHQAAITSLRFSPDNTSLLSGSNDHSARLWDLATGKEVYTLSLHQDLVNNVRFSSNGKLILTCSDDRTIKLWETETGQFLRSFSGGNEKVRDALFTADNRKIVFTQGEVAVVKDRSSGKTLYRFQGYAIPNESISFSSDGYFLGLGSKHEQAKVWDFRSGALINALADQNLVASWSEFSKGKRHFYVSGSGNSVKLWQRQKSELLQSFQGTLPTISADGKMVLTKNGTIQAKLWDVRSGEPIFTLGGHQTILSSMAFGPEGKQAFTCSLDRNVRQWDTETGEPLLSFTVLDTGLLSTIAVHPEGHQIALGFGGEVNKVLLWDLEQGRIIYHLEGHSSFINALEYTSDGQQIISASADGTAKVWSTQTGQPLHTFVGPTVQYGISDLAISPNGRHLATISKENRIRLWNLETGKETGSLIALGKEDWVVTTPEGLFDASPGAMQMMNYVVNYAGDWEFIGLEQLKARYYEPGLLSKLMGFSRERLRSVEGLDIVDLYPKVFGVINRNELNIQLNERNGGIGALSLFVNGKEVQLDANPDRKNEISYDLLKHRNLLLEHPDSVNTISIRALNAAGWLKSSATNLDYQLWQDQKSETVRNWKAELDPKMYVVCIGTANYSGADLDLQFADQDANMISTAFQAVGGALFTKDSLEVHCLTTTEPSVENQNVSWKFPDKNNIQSVFSSIAKRAKAEDVVVVYFSGHGITLTKAEQSQFYYLTHAISNEAMLDDLKSRSLYTVSSDELTQWLNEIPALKQVLMIDACNSGKVVEDFMSNTKNLNSGQVRALDRMKDRTGMFVLSGSASDKVSYETSAYGQGLLTYALLQGMLGLATRKTSKGDYIDVMQLFQFARDEVPRLAQSINGIQTPMLGFPNIGASFDIGMFKPGLDIPVGKQKPVLIRSNFQEENTFSDHLKLGDQLEAAFKQEMEKGKDADFIFVDTNVYAGAFALHGRYVQKDGQISIEARLFGFPNGPITLDIPASEDPERLVKLILRTLKKQLKTLP